MLKLDSIVVDKVLMVVTVSDGEGRTARAQIAERVCGRSFLSQEGALRQILEELLAGINALEALPAVVEVDVVEAAVAQLLPPAKSPSIRPSRAPGKL